MAQNNNWVFSCNSVAEIIAYIGSLVSQRKQVTFGVEKVAGKSFSSLRKEANAKALALLDTLKDGQNLTQDERSILAGYTGEGGIGGSVSEYYTPTPIAEGIWEIMKLYGADTGHTLEPSAGTGVFNETKPAGTVMSATEISPVSGKINQLLHPEDNVSISPFETLASTTPDNSFDNVVGNVPFGGRDNSRNIDKPYAEESDMGAYFMLRMLDKIKPNGYMCVIVPPNIVSGSTNKKLRYRLSKKGEFLGAQRLPTGTFDANGTNTVVDIVVMRKHPEALLNTIGDFSDDMLTEANVLWPEFIAGKWFEQDGKRFIHGDQVKGFQGRIEVKTDGKVDNQALKAKLIHKFDSRILWTVLDMEQAEQKVARTEEGELRLINGSWYQFTAGRWVLSNGAAKELNLSNENYGAESWEDLSRNLQTSEGRLGLSFEQMSNIRRDFQSELSQDMVQLVDWIQKQSPRYRNRLYRGAMIGKMVTDYQDNKSRGASSEKLEQDRLLLADYLQSEIDQFGSPNTGPISRLTGEGSKSWFAFRGAIKPNGGISDEISGVRVTLDTDSAYDATSFTDTLRFLYSDLSQDPIQLDAFRKAFKGTLPANDDALMDMLAQTPGIAISPYGGIIPFSRATSGDIGELIAPKHDYLRKLSDGPIKNNILSQLAAIEEKRVKTAGEDIQFKLNSRWFDRSIILEFLHESGYTDLNYVKTIEVENDQMISPTYDGGDGIFVGHRYGLVQRKDKETGEIRYDWDRKAGENGTGFPAQLEKYLNGARIGGKDASTANDYRDKAAALEKQFNTWLKTHDRYDELVGRYNDVFNGSIPYEHSSDPLNLKGVSGKRVLYAHQNEEVRRLSEDGRGILGFGTGLGKTTTGLAVEAFNFEAGRSARTAYVVPKAVLENWYYEAKEFLSEDAFSNYLFVGLNPIMEAGNIRQVAVLDDAGDPVINADGTPRMRDALQLASEADITARMNSIPHSNYRAVVFTKEQYARIPLRDATIDDHAHDVLSDFVAAGKVVGAMDSDSHRKEAARRRVLAEGSDTGTEKVEKYPYYEDMGFDSVIADEGHNYRNSYKAGREASSLAYLPTSAVSQSAKDMAIKNAYLMKKNGGRGPILLTATPIVNTPIDAYNMLSHVLPKDYWQRLGIYNADDFVKFFGKTSLETVQKLSGEVEEKLALVGFDNLGALRGIFHRWTTLKTAEDVRDTVEIPDLDEHTHSAPMSAKQEAIYENLRKMAAASALGETVLDKSGNPVPPPPIFSIIRNMDRVCTDIDLLYHRITFNFPAQYADALQKLCDSMADVKAASEDEETGEKGEIKAFKYTLKTTGDIVQLQVFEENENEVVKRLAKFGIPEDAISHPVTPKYSALIENLKLFLPQGKQIIFTDEKTQHKKLKRIIAAELDIDASKIGILNGQTVAEAGKGVKKVKAVKPPKDLPDEPTNAQLEKYNEQMELYDAYIAQITEVSLGGLESIAADFQEGRTPIIICNKKAEVGINLHKGTSDIHHLTLPWTPASINQRNGRGARIGSNRDKVRVHYYCGKGSFDEYRLKTLKRKAGWISDILRSDKSSMENADANDMIEMQMYTAKDDGERSQIMQTQMDAAKAAQLARRKELATADFKNYIKAAHAANEDIDKLSSQITNNQALLDKVTSRLADARQSVVDKQQHNEDWKKKFGSVYSSDVSMLAQYRARVKELAQQQKDLTRSIAIDTKVRDRIGKSATELKRLRPLVETAIKEGVIDADMDMLTNPDKYFMDGDRTWKVGGYYQYLSALIQIDKINFETKMADYTLIYTKGRVSSGSGSLAAMRVPTDYTPDLYDILAKVNGGISMADVPDILTKEQFTQLIDQDLLTISESAGMMRDASGALYADISLELSKAVYPDVQDEALKAEAAKWALGLISNNQDYKVRYGQMFLTALFGSAYKAAIYTYADSLSQPDIDQAIAKALDARPIESKGLSINGDSQKEIMNGIYGSGDINTTDFNISPTNIPGLNGYQNVEAIKQAFVSENSRNNDTRRTNLNKALQALSLSTVSAINSRVAGGIMTDKAKDIVIGQADLQQAYRTGETVEVKTIGGWSVVPTQDFVTLFSDMILAGVIKPESVTDTLFIAREYWFGLVSDTRNQLFNRSPDEVKVDTQRINEALGIASEEEPEINDESGNLAVEQGDYRSLASELGLNFRISTSDLKMMYAPKYLAGEVFGLQEASGMKGVLFSAKDELKSKFGAKWLPAKAKNSDFEGNWWIIEMKHNPSEVLALIKNYS